MSTTEVYFTAYISYWKIFNECPATLHKNIMSLNYTSNETIDLIYFQNFQNTSLENVIMQLD